MAMNKWIGKVALVTGVSSGIGYEVVKALVSEGLIVVGTARRLEKLLALKEEAVGKGEFHPQQCDVTKSDDFKRLFDWVENNLGGVDILINSAGVLGSLENIQDIDVNDWKTTIDTNLLGLAVGTKYALKTMRSRGDNGVIMNLNSIIGHYIPSVLGELPISMYVASKHAVTAFTKCVTEELKALKSGIRVSSISPGVVQTEMTEIYLPGTDITYVTAKDCMEAIIFIISRPFNVHIPELTIVPVFQVL